MFRAASESLLAWLQTIVYWSCLDGDPRFANSRTRAPGFSTVVLDSLMADELVSLTKLKRKSGNKKSNKIYIGRIPGGRMGQKPFT